MTSSSWSPAAAPTCRRCSTPRPTRRTACGWSAVGADREDIEGLARARRAGVPDVRLRRGRPRHPRGLGRRAHRAGRGVRPGLVVLAGFMRLTGAAFLARFGGRTVNTHPALLPVLPRHARPPGRARVRRQGHRRDPVRRRRRRRHRADRRPAGRAGGRRRHRREPARAHQDRRARRCSSTAWAGWSATASPSPNERSPSRERASPDQARPDLRLRQEGTGGARAWPARGGGPAGVHRVHGGADRGRGRARHPGRGAHRLPRVPRRPGQDPAPERPRGDPGRHPQPRPRGPAGRPGHRAVRPGRVATSTRSPRRCSRAPRRRSASSRSTSVARRWSAPPPRTTPASPSSPTRPSTPRC